MGAKSYLESRVEAIQFVLPEHLNHMGNMHGGEIMKLMDNTAGLVFMRHAEGRAVTAAVNNLRIIKPIPANQIIKCIAEIMTTGRTSMEVQVELFIEDVEEGVSHKVAEGTFIGVAIDEEGNSRTVSKIER